MALNIEVISPFPMQSLPRVWTWTETYRGRVSDDFGPSSLDEFMDGMLANNRGAQQTWAIYADGELGGMILFQRVNPWLGMTSCVLKPDFHGQGIAPHSYRLAIAEMFGTGIGKLTWYLLAGNLAVASLVCALGGRREGKLKAHTVCNGSPTDIWVYGLTKLQFEEPTQ